MNRLGHDQQPWRCFFCVARVDQGKPIMDSPMSSPPVRVDTVTPVSTRAQLPQCYLILVAKSDLDDG